MLPSSNPGMDQFVPYEPNKEPTKQSPRSSTLGPHRLHPSAAFEGFYTKFAFPSGGTLVLVLCTVPQAPKNAVRHNLSVVYVPPSGEPWTHEVFPAQILTQTTNQSTGAFVLVCLDAQGKELASLTTSLERNEYSIDLKDPPLRFAATTTHRTPWSSSSSLFSSLCSFLPTFLNPANFHVASPEGLLSHLPLPLHWHIHSLASITAYTLALPLAAHQYHDDRTGLSTAHEEKNWANGFPSAHVWCQARKLHPRSRSPLAASNLIYARGNGSGSTQYQSEPDNEQGGSSNSSGICLAGGRTMGLNAFLLGYRNEALGLEIDLRPPFAVGVPLPFLGVSVSPFLAFEVDWPSRRWSVDIAGWSWRVVVDASGPGSSDHESRDTNDSAKGAAQDTENGWFTLSSPKPGGFEGQGMAQTTRGTMRVRVLRRTWGWFGWDGLWRWEEVCSETFEGAGMEFGGEYYTGGR